MHAPTKSNFIFSFRERVPAPKDENNHNNDCENLSGSNLHSPTGVTNSGDSDTPNGPSNSMTRCLLKSASISGSKCIDVKQSKDPEVFSSLLTWLERKSSEYIQYSIMISLIMLTTFLSSPQEETIPEANDEAVDELSEKVAALLA